MFHLIKLHLCLHFVFFSLVFLFLSSFFFYGKNIPSFEILNLIFSFSLHVLRLFSIHSYYWGFISATSIFFSFLASSFAIVFPPHTTRLFPFLRSSLSAPPEKNGTAKKNFFTNFLNETLRL